MPPQIDKSLWGAIIGELTYNAVEGFANTDVTTNIFFGKTYTPFQNYIKYGQFIHLTIVTCNANELIHACYEENITDYYKVIEKMESLNKKSNENGKT